MSTREIRYDGLRDWYDPKAAESMRSSRDALTRLLGPGSGWCLDLGCGTGQYLDLIRSTGRSPVGLELSGDLLSRASERGQHLVHGDAAALPFADESFDTVAAIWISTDVDDFAAVVREAVRVLRPGGIFVFYGVHPCFNGPGVEPRPDGTVVVHPIYRQARRHLSSPWWGRDGIRHRVGGMRHVPLAELFNTLLAAGLEVTQVVEPRDDPIPAILAITARAAKVRG